MRNWRKIAFCALVALALVLGGSVALSPAAHAQAGLPQAPFKEQFWTRKAAPSLAQR